MGILPIAECQSLVVLGILVLCGTDDGNDQLICWAKAGSSVRLNYTRHDCPCKDVSRWSLHWTGREELRFESLS
jgi:hypothetical protein